MILIERARNLIEDKDCDREGNSKKCYFVNLDGNDYVLLIYKCKEEYQKRILSKINGTMHLINQGFHTPDIYDVYFDDDIVYELQGRAKGKAFSYRHIAQAGGPENYVNDLLISLKALEFTDKSNMMSLLNDAKLYRENGYSLDCHSDNFFIDEEGKISMIDLCITEDPKKTDPYYISYVNTLPSIMSSSRVSPDMPRYDECVASARNIASMWLDTCIEFLLQNNLSIEEIRETINSMGFNYFYINPEEKELMIKKSIEGRNI